MQQNGQQGVLEKTGILFRSSTKDSAASLLSARREKTDSHRKLIVTPGTQESLREELDAAEELSKQMQRVLQAQSHKIEELRGNADGSTRKMLEESRLRRDAAKKDEKPLAMRLRRLINEVRDATATNADLKRIQRRYQKMLGQVHPGCGVEPAYPLSGVPLRLPISPCGHGSERSTSPVTPRQALSGHMRSTGYASERFVSPASPRQYFGESMRPTASFTEKLPTKVSSQDMCHAVAGDGHLCSLLSVTSQALWREQQSPRGVLSWLLRGCEQMLKSSPGTASYVLTLYVFDEWLCSGMAEVPEGGAVLPSASYELTGISSQSLPGCQAQAYQRRGQVERPQFRSKEELPIVDVGRLVLPLQAAKKKTAVEATRKNPVVAAIQVFSRERQEELHKTYGAEKDDSEQDLPHWLKSCLQLLCSTAVGIISLRRQVDMAEGIRGRVRDCLAVTGALHGSDDLPALEQLVKRELGRFFHVERVRMLLYDSTANELACAIPVEGDAQGRKQIFRVAARSGVVGRVCRKREVMHIDPICRSVAVSERADDVSLSEDLAVGNMLAGPMVAELPDTREELLMGVIQLMGKTKRTGFGAAELGQPTEEDQGNIPRRKYVPFTDEDRYFFAQQCRILGLAAYRTMQVQELSRHSDRVGGDFNIAALLI